MVRPEFIVHDYFAVRERANLEVLSDDLFLGRTKRLDAVKDQSLLEI